MKPSLAALFVSFELAKGSRDMGDTIACYPASRNR